MCLPLTVWPHRFTRRSPARFEQDPTLSRAAETRKAHTLAAECLRDLLVKNGGVCVRDIDPARLSVGESSPCPGLIYLIQINLFDLN